jgi:hypothetical protein
MHMDVGHTGILHMILCAVIASSGRMNQFRVEKGVSKEDGSNLLSSIDPNKHLISNEMLIDPVKRVRYAGAIRVNEQGEPIAS